MQAKRQQRQQRKPPERIERGPSPRRLPTEHAMLCCVSVRREPVAQFFCIKAHRRSCVSMKAATYDQNRFSPISAQAMGKRHFAGSTDSLEETL